MLKGEIQLLSFTCWRQAFSFGDGVDDIHAKAQDTLIQPEAHDVMDSFPDPGVVPVQVTLAWREHGQVVFIGVFIFLPGTAPEGAEPVVGWKAFSVFSGSPFPEDVV